MIILTIRTDSPISELGLYDNDKQIAYMKWEADRKLAETINTKIKKLLDINHVELTQLEGVLAYKGPGSFTGLRIGLSVANALAQGLNIPIVSTNKDDWINEGLKQLANGEDERRALPEYGALPHITSPKK